MLNDENFPWRDDVWLWKIFSLENLFEEFFFGKMERKFLGLLHFTGPTCELFLVSWMQMQRKSKFDRVLQTETIASFSFSWGPTWVRPLNWTFLGYYDGKHHLQNSDFVQHFLCPLWTRNRKWTKNRCRHLLWHGSTSRIIPKKSGPGVCLGNPLGNCKKI